MAKYTIDYACGHGSHVEQLFGKTSERERRIEWEEANRVCPDCYKAQLKAADEAAEPKAKIRVMCNGVTITLRAEVTGQIEKNKEALAALGIRRQPGSSGFMDFFSTRQTWFCGVEKSINTVEALIGEAEQLRDGLAALGYTVSVDADPSSVDVALATELLRRKAEENRLKQEREQADPRPPNSSLRQRIAELEKSTGFRWNGKIYGRPGSWNFYVDGVKHLASDSEVSEREENLKLHTAWKQRNP